MFPHMAEGSLGVLIDNSTVWTEGQLPALSTNANQLPHQALMLVEVCQEEFPVCSHTELWRYYSCQVGWPCIHKGRQSCQEMFLQTVQGVQGDPVHHSSKLVRVTLCKKTLFLENGQPMIRYYLRWFQLQCCSSRYEALRGVDVLLGGRTSSL